MIRTYKLVIEYDGTAFYGWQRQNELPTVQGIIEKTLSTIFNTEITISGSGRTDAGVHAWAQVASFIAEDRLHPDTVKKALNSMISQPIVIQDCQLVDDDFHAQYSAVSKEYHYFILNREDPCAIKRNYNWHIRTPLDLEKMNQCCGIICGVHDFKSFENTGSPRSSTTRQVFAAQVEPHGQDELVFKISASGFLKYMVRNLVGTIVDVGLGKISVDRFQQILEAKDRKKAGVTAPARGLFLKQVNY